MGRFALFAWAFLFLALCMSGAVVLAEDDLDDDDLEVADEIDSGNIKSGASAHEELAESIRMANDFHAQQERRERAEAAFADEDEDGLQAVINELEELDIQNKQAYLDLAVLYEKLSTIMEDDEASDANKLKSRDFLEMAQEEAAKEYEAERADKKARRIARREAKKAEEAKRAKEEAENPKKKGGKRGSKGGPGGGPGGSAGAPQGGILLDGTLAVPALLCLLGMLGGVAFIATKLGEAPEPYKKPGKAKKQGKKTQ